MMSIGWGNVSISHVVLVTCKSLGSLVRIMSNSRVIFPNLYLS